MPISFSSPGERDLRVRGHGVTAVLGPTNTGKTHLAIERMLAHSSGLIGLPLRLLAREVYNKVASRVGEDSVALITGEEKIKPANPRYWVSTVEAMPRNLDVAFAAVDEVQLGADLERGHVFTDRMLNCRGREETLVLGAATVRPMIEKLLPGANLLSRPRLSQLTHAGEKKITRQPRRTAIVAFAADEVYAIAELVRRQRGGAAVVLGALSPRTRNAQVALYQSGDVDYLVATDAIGMGLNLDVDHVAFASDRKFDGYQFRRLNPAEFAQIAGRAGRATRDGTFGTTGRCPPFDAELVHALESHNFEPVKVLQWRNSDLDFSSLGALAASLAQLPPQPSLTRAPVAEDILVFEHAARDDEVRGLATTRSAVERLWDVCQIPDYRKISPAAHAELVITLYGFLLRDGRISDDWFAQQVAQADHIEGDIDTLSTRIAHIRTWTFAANRPDWLADPDHWQGVARAIEDRLSDALHERLTDRFIDRRTSVLMRRLRENTMLETEITKTGEVVVEGHIIGRLGGFRFAPDTTQGSSDAKALSAAAQKALAGEIEARANKLSHAADSQFVLTSDATIRWVGEPVAKILSGDNVLRPRVRVLADEHLTGAALEAVQTRLDLWTRTHIERLLGPLFVLGAAEEIVGLARGIAFQLVEALGVLERGRVAEDVKSLDQEARAVLRKHGVRFGAYHIYLPLQLKPAPRALAAQLWALKHGGPEIKGLDELQRLASSGRTSFPADKDVQRQLYRTIGYRVCGERAVRVDILERLADLIRPALAWRPGSPTRPSGVFEGGGFTVTQGMTSLTGASGEDFASILRALGYRMEKRPKPPPILPAQEAAAEEPLPQPSEAADQASAGAAVASAEPGEPSTIVIVSEAPVVEETLSGYPAGEPPAEQTSDEDTSACEKRGARTAAAPVEPVDLTDERVPEEISVTPLSASGEFATDSVAVVGVIETAIAASVISVLDNAALQSVVEASGGEASEQSGGVIGVETAPPAEPELVEVWRPSRNEERRPPRREPRRQRRDAAPRHVPPAAADTLENAASVSVEATTANATAIVQTGHVASETAGDSTGKPERQRRRSHQEFRRDRDEQGRHPPRDRERHSTAPEGRGEREDRGDRVGRGEGQRRERPAFAKGGRQDFRHERRHEQQYRGEYAPRRERDKQPDPDSPFAKLAALKAQLEANAKEPR